MANARFEPSDHESINDSAQVTDPPTYCEDISTEDIISSSPLLQDPYEAQNVYVDDSTLGSHAGQGLFAKRDLPSDVQIFITLIII